jgi:hypothetical protein
MSDFGEVAQRLAALIVRREELNDEWDALQAKIFETVAETRATLEREERGERTEVISIPDRIRLRRADTETFAGPGSGTFAWAPAATEVGQAAIVPCPEECPERLPHFHTADGGVHPRPVLEGFPKSS